MNLLKINQLSFHYPDQPNLFNHLSCSLQEGEILTILGPNGIGKSTLLKCLMGLLKPTAGSVTVNDQPLSKLSPRQLAQWIAYVPQHVPDPGSLTVSDYLVTGRTPYLEFTQTPGDSDYELVQDALAKLSLTALKDQEVNTLSGGQFQMVTIAKALVQSPKLIILDEPTAALDFGRQKQVIELIQSLAKHHFAVLHTTHNPNHAFMLGHQVGLFSPDGHFESGEADQLLTEERLKQTYGTDLKLIYEAELGRYVCELV
ncbi:ABC transporter ATP-binding protein [Lactobacillus sp. LC28-10]|uniref:ABC transporter ATP-binding protein n=1 Tax=Secundilactobacillus angelensis TaxID=2722706 RepID=A0ABX1KVC0_9LACO|nr:ABC transporter ATP-binding protein [Secundilactobacillus angelensis]MCH5461235.1 ABC transporter ATP-binding protein [Secundilactobacillus angelensis]NLR17569.1 ABC transporter ATP-binding protein [Secundilactobacillus angelensis]